MKNNIIVCGALAYDRIMDFPGKFSEHILTGKTHILNLSFTVNEVKESFGGTGGNIAYNLSLLGEKPKLVAVVGKDFGKYAKWLKKNKIDISSVKVVKDELTASAYTMTDLADNQITAFYPGNKIQISLTSSIKGVKCNPPNLLPARTTDAVQSGGYQEGIIAIIAPSIVARMVEYAKIFKQNNISYIFDPGQQVAYYSARELEYAIKGAKMLIGNDYEIQLILNKLKIKLSALQKLVEILVITKGGRGAELYNQNKKIIVPAAKKKISIDTTGAGDAFRAGFIKGLVMRLELKQCTRLACVASAYAVENQGTQNHKFTWPEVKRRYQENYGERL
ncbi:MAG: carbohydrate kinase family protein [Candidatus Falkowbacteria bacterium]